MASKQDILFGLDGILGQCAVAKQLLETQGQSTMPVDSIFSATIILRELVDADVQADAPADDGTCKHPADSTYTTQVGGGHYYITCKACNDIIEQG